MSDTRPSTTVRRAAILALAAWVLTSPVGAWAQEEEKTLSSVTTPMLLLRDGFERDELTGWDFTDPAAWRISRQDPAHGRVLEQFQQSKYEPPVRSPFNIALAKNLDLQDVTIDVRARSTTADYNHRDLCLVFGYQDPSHFYYVHLGKAADEHANSIFIVNGKPRVSIAESRTQGTPWTNSWHRLRLVRKVDEGLIQVYFDDMEHPAMTAHDKTFAHGRVGIGSFDDTGMFDDVRVFGQIYVRTGAP
jgi:hypothetical protein